MKDRTLYKLSAAAIIAGLALVGNLAFGQVGPFSGPGGSQPTAGLQPPIGGAAAQTKSTAAPTGTASTTPVMCGCAVTIQPSSNGIILATFVGSITNNTSTDGGAVQIAYGTGAAPANAAAPVGTVAGSVHTWIGGTTTAGTGMFSVTALVNVNPPTNVAPIWIDLQFKAVTGGTATLSAVDAIATEQ